MRQKHYEANLFSTLDSYILCTNLCTQVALRHPHATFHTWQAKRISSYNHAQLCMQPIPPNNNCLCCIPRDAGLPAAAQIPNRLEPATRLGLGHIIAKTGVVWPRQRAVWVHAPLPHPDSRLLNPRLPPAFYFKHTTQDFDG